jgi:hypothetical protein
VRASEAVARHGAAVPRGQDLDPGRDPPQGRFGRMFPGLLPCDVSSGAIDELVTWMGDPSRSQEGNSRIPAGFTYLGQFIDHDITFDPTSKLDAIVDPHALVNFRTPRLDLDSIYGSGPVAQPYLYDWKDSEPPGARLLVGHNKVEGHSEVDDLPRNHQGRALIGDMRNDENAIVAQLHLLFIRFHNAVVDHLCREGKVTDRDELFDKAQRIVRWHYQWIVAHEFLPAVVGEKMAGDVLSSPADGSAPTVHRKFFRWHDAPFIPVEFSGAAYRFGHSMVRAEYGVKRIPESGPIVHPLPLFPDLAGFTWLSESHVIDWERFFVLPDATHSPQASLKIDTAIVRRLFELPDENPEHRELPRRNLRRARVLGLPSGQDVACVMHESPLTEAELQLEHMPQSREELKCATPLWFYILCETARAVDPDGRPEPGEHLGPVGGRIVAEVLAGLLEGDPSSYLNQDPPWRPRAFGPDGKFTMADLLKAAQR